MMHDPYLRPVVDRELEASKLMQRVFDTPLLIHPSRAAMIVASISAKYGIKSIAMDGEMVDPAGMNAMVAAGRQRAQERDAQRRDGRIFRESEGIAVIEVWGTLTKTWGLDPFSGMTGYDGIEAKLTAAMADENVKGIWLDLESGGGAVDGLFDLCDLISACNAANGGKPIFAMCNDYAYSAAYAIASCADKRFITRTGGAGSVGVITLHASFRRAMEEAGIDVTVIRSGDEKARANAYEDLPEHTREYIQYQVDTVREMFVNLVAENLGTRMSKKSVRDTEGLDYMGEDARAIGFVNEVCSEREAWAKLVRRINR